MNYIENKTPTNIYNALIENNHNPILIIEPKGTIQSLNFAAVKLFKKRAIDLVNRHCSELLDLNGKPQQFEWSNLDKPQVFQKHLKNDEANSYFEIRSIPIFEQEELTCVVFTFKNVSELVELRVKAEKYQKSESKIQQSEEKYRLITENMTDLVTVINEKCEVTYTSPSRTHILGSLPSDALGHSIYDFVHPDDYKSLKNFIEKLFLTKKTETLEFRYQHEEQEWIWIETKGKYFLNKDKDASFLLLVSRDVEERKEMRDKLKLMAFQDELTGLPNRRAFHEEVSRVLAASKKIMKNSLFFT